MLGLYLIPFVANLLLFGWILGIFTTAIILRYGTQAQILAFGLIFIIQPFSAVFYPVSALPYTLQIVSLALPSAHVFEGLRAVLLGHSFPAGPFPNSASFSSPRSKTPSKQSLNPKVP